MTVAIDPSGNNDIDGILWVGRGGALALKV